MKGTTSGPALEDGSENSMSTLSRENCIAEYAPEI